ERCVCVIVISGDTALREASETLVATAASLLPATPSIRPSDSAVAQLAAMLNAGRRVTLLCGSGCAGARRELLALGQKLQSPMVHAMRGKEHVEGDTPYDVGMTGLIGFSSGYYAMMDCDVLLMLGTDFPYRQFYPDKARIAQVDIRPEAIGRRARVELGVIGDVRETLIALLPRLDAKTDSSHLDKARDHYKKARQSLDELATGS